MYMNSGDWVENLTALEYHQGVWTLYRHADHKHLPYSRSMESAIPNFSQLEILLQQELANSVGIPINKMI